MEESLRERWTREYLGNIGVPDALIDQAQHAARLEALSLRAWVIAAIEDRIATHP